MKKFVSIGKTCAAHSGGFFISSISAKTNMKLIMTIRK